MEKFKACEKEMKTKAFSKEGLIQAAKLDPKEQEKEEATIWLQTQVEELQMQVEQAEAEIEILQGQRKKKAPVPPRLEQLEHLNDRRKWHISRLELVLRMLNNGSLTTERVMALHEDVGYFVESNMVRHSLCPLLPLNMCRVKNLRRTRVYTMNSTLTKRKLNSASLRTTMIAMPQTLQVKVRSHSSAMLNLYSFLDMPLRTPKKHDEESVTSSKREDSPILKKAAVTLQLRSAYSGYFSLRVTQMNH